LDFNTEGTEFTEERSSDGKRKLSKYGRKLVEGDDARSMGQGSTRIGILSIYLSWFIVLIRTQCDHSNATSGSRGVARSWPDVNWFDMTVETCGKVENHTKKGGYLAQLRVHKANWVNRALPPPADAGNLGTNYLQC
jgi:hypothetical protein